MIWRSATAVTGKMKILPLPKLPRPPKTATLLGPGQPWKMNACLNISGDITHGYIEGYRKGAERLVEWVEVELTDQDYLVYPILFLYRHHLELRLKEILGLLRSVGLRKDPPPKGHDIRQQWSEAKAVLFRLAGAGDKEWFRSVSDCISPARSCCGQFHCCRPRIQRPAMLAPLSGWFRRSVSDRDGPQK